MEKTQDRRIQKTRQALQEALLELIQEKELSRVTVKELVERANVNRKTFYNHYSDVYGVLDDMENELIGKLAGRICRLSPAEFAHSPNLLMHEVMQEFQENERIYTILINAGDQSHLLSKVVAEEKKILRGIYRGDPGGHDQWEDYFLNFFASGAMAVFETWYHSGRRVPIDDISEFFDAMSKIYNKELFVIQGERGASPGGRK